METTPPPTERLVREPSGIGICCSGGGIRSAAYNLGTLQELGAAGVLDSADYLAAVSGGSYIASAFATVARHSDPELLAAQKPFAPGSPEEEFLRNRCSYLAAGFGGKLRLVVSVLVGILANFVLLTLLLWDVGRPLGWAYARFQLQVLSPSAHVSLRHVAVPALATGALAGLGVALALFARMFHPGPAARNLLNRVGAAMVITAIGAAFLLLGLPALVALIQNLLGTSMAGTSQRTSSKWVAGISGGGLVASVAGILSQVIGRLRLGSTLSTVEKEVTRFTKLNARVRRAFLYSIGGLVGPLALLGGLVLIVNASAHLVGPHAPPSTPELIGSAAVLAVTLLVLQFADLTSWSMHPFYKQRLASAFSIKRARAKDGRPVARQIRCKQPVVLSEFAPDQMPVPFPELLICAAANISDESVTPPGATVTSFVFSPTRVGGPLVGYMRTAKYEARIGKRRSLDATVPAAVAMSGAAVAPSMGKMTIAPLRFLLALGNVRLGVWMPNPRRLPKGGHVLPANPRPELLLDEVVGRHRLNGRYLYITDGGHYENLGLVELLRRKCRLIFCFDASGGKVGTFATLGQAIALARVEGVEIAVDPTAIRLAHEGDLCCSSDHVVGDITYADGTTGRLVFARAAVTKELPWDVRAYAEKDQQFPSHSTAEQLYTGERFEAYHTLGRYAGRAALEAAEPELSLLISESRLAAGSDTGDKGRASSVTEPNSSGTRSARAPSLLPSMALILWARFAKPLRARYGRWDRANRTTPAQARRR